MAAAAAHHDDRGRRGGVGGGGGGGGRTGGGQEGRALVGWPAVDCLYHGFCASGCTQVGCGFRHRDLRTADRSLCPDWTARSRGVGLPSCPGGADCTATHPNVMVLGLYDCPRYLAGGPDACNADACWLRHSSEVADAAQRGTAKVCRDWLNDWCHAGVACPYVHTTGRMPATMTSYGFDFLTRMLLSRPSPAAPPPRRRRVFVAWDIENALLPSDAVVSHVMATLREKLAEVLHLDEGMVVDTMAFYNAHLKGRYALTDTVVSNLRVAGVVAVDVGSKDGAADHALKDAVARKLRERADGLPLEAIVVVSGDGDFASTLRDIREEGCTAVLVAGPFPKREMVDEARIKFYWNDVLTASGASRVVASPHSPTPTPKPTPPPHPTGGSIPFRSSPLASGTLPRSMSAAARSPAVTRPPGAMPSPAAADIPPAPAAHSPTTVETTAAAVAAALLMPWPDAAASTPAAARSHTAVSSPSAASSPAQYRGWFLSGMDGRDGP